MTQNGKLICRIKGNYMGYVDFDGVRYWDARECLPIDMIPIEE